MKTKKQAIQEVIDYVKPTGNELNYLRDLLEGIAIKAVLEYQYKDLADKGEPEPDNSFPDQEMLIQHKGI